VDAVFLGKRWLSLEVLDSLLPLPFKANAAGPSK
jgi:hypothetical protein